MSTTRVRKNTVAIVEERRDLPVAKDYNPLTGRHTKYCEFMNKQVYKLSLLGMTVPRIAEVLCISEDTFYDWCRNYTAFAEAYLAGGEKADANVVDALYKIATGFTRQKEVVTKDGEVITVEEYYPPDVRAGKFWLGTRKGTRKDWTDVNRQEPGTPAQVAVGVTINNDPQQAAIRYKELMTIK